MQLQSEKSHRFDEIKTQFRAREGYYRLMNSPDYSQRSQRAMGFSTGTTNSNSSTASHEKTCIKISLVTINENNDPILNPRKVIQRNPSSATTNSSTIRTHIRSRGAQDKKICFNVGRELFVYNYDGVRTGPDASNPIYKHSYKGSSPTSHDFNQTTASPGSLSLLVGFSHGQVQLIEMNGSGDQETCKEFNSDRLIDKTRVTCIKWLPNSPSLFLVAHASGHLYLYKDDLPCGPAAPVYQIYKRTDGVVVCTCKTKTTRNPIYRWTIGQSSTDSTSPNVNPGSSGSLHNLENESCSLNEFVFSPCAKYLACVSQDGFLRVYCYDTMELIGRARSYYGGLSCACWSPDGKYIVTGGEDDLITVWSFLERRVVARGVGHKSWVSVVAFDSFYTGYDLKDTDVDNDEDEDEEEKEVDERDLEVEGEDDDDYDITSYTDSRTRQRVNNFNENSTEDAKSFFRARYRNTNSHYSPSMLDSSFKEEMHHSPTMTSYRFGSVGQDTQLCLWDLNDDLLKQPIAKSKISANSDVTSVNNLNDNSNSSLLNSSSVQKVNDKSLTVDTTESAIATDGQHNDLNHTKESTTSAPTAGGFLSNKGSGFTKTFSLVGRRDKRNFSLRNTDKNSSSKNTVNTCSDANKIVDDPLKLLGTPICPRMNEVPLLEPTVCKKISFEQLTSLVFCRGGFITSCQDGYVFSWARPSRKSLKISPGQSNEELRVIDVGTSSLV